MKRYALVFLAAIFLPSLVLGWLALRTAGEQRVLIERQAADLHQVETDVIAQQIRSRVEALQREFNEAIHRLAAEQSPTAVAENYGPALTSVWSHGGIPFAINPAGRIAYPSPAQARQQNRLETFLRDNAAFLSNATTVEVYSQQMPTQQAKAQPNRYVVGKATTGMAQSLRNIAPQSVADVAQAPPPSRLEAETSDFQTAVSGAAQGVLARFVQNELQVLFYTRPDPSSQWLFGLMLDASDLKTQIRDTLPASPPEGARIAILNDKARAVLQVPTEFTADWKHPLVASEIGEYLPHWEVALYLADPGALAASARLVSLMLILLIALALGAILAGGYLVAIDTRRQLALAQQKTDFVSNVSHELKTPLTSIRMFAELLAEDRVREPEKRARYLKIIAGESERLTRLVNNVLDFARLEKNRKNYQLQKIDAHEMLSRVWEAESSRLREAGFLVAWEEAPGPYSMIADSDALAQAVINLLSNAEKYGGERREITLTSRLCGDRLEISVADRGPGVPAGKEEQIFEPFFRVDDSLTSETQGSGLGLTLARRIARDHGGDISLRPREGGGSIFTLHLPLAS